MSVKITRWEGCYDSSWKGAITNASFAHPAKFARGLIERIYDHCLAQGYLKRGDLVADVFGGIGTGGITAAYRGLNWIGCELEPKFVALAQENFKLHQHGWSAARGGSAKIIQGDSRKFDEHAAAVVNSPPYAETAPEAHGPGIDIEKHYRTYRASGGGCSFEKFKASREKHSHGYGKTAGQISQLKGGSVDACVSSPPFENSLLTTDTKFMAKVEKDKRNGSRLQPGIGEYGSTEGQIGKEAGETYWQACDQVYRACFRCIRPGGVIVLVVKDYCKAGKRVRLCDDTMRLLEHIGFEPLERIHAMLVTETVENGLFGEERTKRQRKSFFRRLYEARIPEGDERRIDHEEVLIARRPLTQ